MIYNTYLLHNFSLFQDIISNDGIGLDWSFKSSLASDLINVATKSILICCITIANKHVYECNKFVLV